MNSRPALPTGTLPIGALPTGALPIGALPTGTLPTGTLPIGALPTGALPTGALPTGALPTGTLPSGTLPSGTLPSGALPTDAAPTGTVHSAGTVAATVPPAGVVQQTSAPIRYQMLLPPLNQNLVAAPAIPFRTVYSLTVHATLISITTVAGVFLTAAVTKATAAGSKTPQKDIDSYNKMIRLYKFVAVPYIASFFIYYVFPRASSGWCLVRLIYDEISMFLGFAALILISASFSDHAYMLYMISWFSVVFGLRVVYLLINQFVNFTGREPPVPC